MRKVITFTFVLVLIGAGIYYFAPSGRSPAKLPLAGPADTSPTAEIGGVAEIGGTEASTPGRVLGAQLQRIGGSIQNFASSTGYVLGNAVTGFVDGVVGNAVQNAKEAIVDQVADALGVARLEEGFGVCSAHKTGEPVVFLIEVPAATSTAAYSVDWGDGQATDSPASPGITSILVSHEYGKSGNYTVKFAGLVAGSLEILARKEVCVREE